MKLLWQHFWLLPLVLLASCDQQDAPPEEASIGAVSEWKGSKEPKEALRTCGPIFTILWNPNGLTKESSAIFTSEELQQAMNKATYMGPYYLQLKSPISDHYFRQDCIVVLESKAGIDLTIYEERIGTQKKRFILAYFMDGNGMHLYEIP